MHRIIVRHFSGSGEVVGELQRRDGAYWFYVDCITRLDIRANIDPLDQLAFRRALREMATQNDIATMPPIVRAK